MVFAGTVSAHLLMTTPYKQFSVQAPGVTAPHGEAGVGGAEEDPS